MLQIRQKSRIREMAHAWHARFSDSRMAAGQPARRAVPGLTSEPISSHDEYVRYRAASQAEYADREQVSRSLVTRTERVGTQGFCFCCQASRIFETPYPRFNDPDRGVPDWREGMICPGCSLNSRMRAAAHMLRESLEPRLRAAFT